MGAIQRIMKDHGNARDGHIRVANKPQAWNEFQEKL